MADQGLSSRDPRVRSVVAVAPAAGMALTKQSLEQISVPTLILVGDRDSTAPAASNASRLAALIPGARLTVLPGVGHYTFLAECGIAGRVAASLICVDEADVSRRDIHQRVAEDAREFFDATLGGS